MISLTRSLVSALPLLLLAPLSLPRGDGGVPDDKDKELQKLQALLDRKSGDSQALAAELLAENSKLRIERHGLREEVKTTTAKVPAQGAVILTGDDLAKWKAVQDAGEGAAVLPKDRAARLDAYEKLGAPDALATQLESGKAAFEKNARRERADSLGNAAKFKMNVDGQEATFKPSLLKAVAKDWDVRMRETEVTDAQGKVTKEERPFVVTRDGEAETFTPLAERVKAEGDDVYRDMLAFEDDSNGGQGGANTGIQFPSQGGGSRVSSTAMLDNFSESRYGHVLPKKAD